MSRSYICFLVDNNNGYITDYINSCLIRSCIYFAVYVYCRLVDFFYIFFIMLDISPAIVRILIHRLQVHASIV